jgi:C-3',4' desaturase CrtD
MAFDYVVIGAGYGGLAAAALLQKRGHATLLLEGHATLGGCASFFRRKGFTFDVGATTLSGLRPAQPLGKLFASLNLQPDVVKLDPGMVIQMDGRSITRHAALESWISEAESHFPQTRQREFWQKIYALNEAAWPAVNASPRFPPASLSDVISLARPANLRHAPLVPGLFRPLSALLDEYGLNDPNFRRFLDEQLLISAQNTAENVPYLTAAMGLAYPSETYYPTGGMYRPALLLLREFRRLGGVAHFNQKVTKIEKRPAGYALATQRGDEWTARGVVSNVSLWNMGELAQGDLSDYFQRLAARYDWAWGAFTVYFAVEDKAVLPTAYHQIHLPAALPHCHSHSIFVSFSQRGDHAKAPQGWRTVTISAHTRAEDWHGLSAEQYTARKEAAERAALREFDRAFPEFASAEKRFVASGTPRTFEHYTNRRLGFVGGIPHSLRNNPLRLAPNATPFRDFYMVGDSVFPGQGTPAVVLGALNVATRVGVKAVNRKP